MDPRVPQLEGETPSASSHSTSCPELPSVKKTTEIGRGPSVVSGSTYQLPQETSATGSPIHALPHQSQSGASLPSSNSTLTFSSSLGSTTSLALPAEIAQSGRAYFQSLPLQRSKIKSRPSLGSLSSIPEKKRFFKFRSKKDEDRNEVKEYPKESQPNWRSRLTSLGKKAAENMRQLIGADDGKMAPMNWDDFLKIMNEMGFSHESTFGSRVKFYPPDPADRSITIHKPHPDSTLTPRQLKKIGKRLKKYYGWSSDNFYSAK